MCTCGIDPGTSGAIVIVDDRGDILAVHDMPITVSKMSSGKMLKRVDAKAVSLILGSYPIETFVIEDVHAMPGQGVSSVFSFGHAFGTVDALAHATGAKVKKVSPSSWKRDLGLSSDKDLSRSLATAVHGSGEHWPLVRHDGRAEAYLMALMGQS